MWIIRTRPASASISLEARTPTDDYPAPTQESVSFDLIPTDERDHLDLDTGEVFQDYNYARLHKKEQNLIGASITIRPLPDESYYKYNIMGYRGEIKGDEYSSAPSIFFTVFIAPTAFREFVDNVRNGLLPETITIELSEKAPFKYGWEPDGSGMIWYNKRQENKRVPIERITFQYTVVKAQYDEEQTGRLLPMPSHDLTDRINEQIAPIQTTLAEMLKQLRWTMMGVAGLVVIIVWFLIAKRASF